MNELRPLVVEAGALFTPHIKFSPARLIINGPFISDVGSADAIRLPRRAEFIDASQWIVTPGFIEPHIHGAGGVDVMDGTYDSLNTVSQNLASHGTTAFLPTTVSSPPDVLTNAVKRLGRLITSRSFEGARPVGIHLEGPFINAIKRGTHRAMNVIPPDAALLENWIRVSADLVRLVTVAPEVEGVESLYQVAGQFGVTVAMGHSNATFDEAHRATDCGIHYAVHTFNAMREFSHRDPGIIGQVLSDDRIFAEIIADGIHVSPPVVRLLARAKGKDKVVLVTDAISATDMPDGRYSLGTDTVNVINRICRDSEGRLAGSTLTQDAGLRNFAQWSGWPLEDVLLGLTVNPARALKLQGKGVLEAGAAADVTILDKNLSVVKTLVAGKVVFERTSNI